MKTAFDRLYINRSQLRKESLSLRIFFHKILPKLKSKENKQKITEK